MSGNHKKSIEKIRETRLREFDNGSLIADLKNGSPIALSKAITIIESHNSRDRIRAEELLRQLLPYSGKSTRIGISGIPGSGKSTFIEALGSFLTGLGKKVAVLAIDPSSEEGKGSILADKTRMVSLSTDPLAFVRPSPTAGVLGGVAEKTRESIYLCEAAGYEIILIETVGVGQSETEVHSMADFYILILLAGAGDELQGIKRGIMEMVDLVLINKADGENIAKAKNAAQEIARALHFFSSRKSGWVPETKVCSSLEKSGIREVWDTILAFKKLTQENGFFETNRREQLIYWLHKSIKNQLVQGFYENIEIRKKISAIENKIQNQEISVREAAKNLLDIYKKSGS